MLANALFALVFYIKHLYTRHSHVYLQQIVNVCFICIVITRWPSCENLLSSCLIYFSCSPAKMANYHGHRLKGMIIIWVAFKGSLIITFFYYGLCTKFLNFLIGTKTWTSIACLVFLSCTTPATIHFQPQDWKVLFFFSEINNLKIQLCWFRYTLPDVEV